MKILKIILLSFLSIFVAVYLTFLFILPYAIDLNKYAPQITEEIKKNTGFQVDIKGLKVKTAWNLSAGAEIKKTDLKYPTGEKFAQINDLEVKLSLLPLFVGKIRVDSVDLEKIIMNLKVEKDGKFLVEKYLPKTSAASAPQGQIPFEFSPSMPDIKADKYKITFIDAKTSKHYSIKGEDFKVSDFVLDKKIKVAAKGQAILDGRKQISYDLSLSSKLFPQPAQKDLKTKQPTLNVIDVFKELYKYNLKAEINANLKIKGEQDNPEIDGKVELNQIAFTLGGVTLPNSNLKLDFDGDKVKINSNFYTDLDEKAVITGVFDNGRKKSINLKVVSDKTDIGNTFLIANTLLNVFGINDLEGVKANGHLNANFNLKSDFKTIHSTGFLKVENASVVHSLYKVALRAINADIDFSQNNIDINRASAKLNGEPIILKGTIDSKANANLSVFAEKLQLKGILLTLGQVQVLKENDIYSGFVSLKAALKGRLDKAIPTADILVQNVALKNRPNKVLIKMSNAKIKAVSRGKTNEGKFGGKIEVSGLKLFPSSTIKVVSLPTLSLSFDEKNMKIEQGLVYMNSSKIDIFGRVNNYSNSKMNIDVTAKGLMFARDIKSMLPPANQKGVSAVGKIPLLVRITGGSKMDIYAQMLANNTNHLAVFDISSLRGKTSLIAAQLTLAGEDLKINEVGLYSLNVNRGLSSDMKANRASGTKIVTVTGKISDISGSNPSLHGIDVSIPNQIATSIPGYPGSNLRVKGDLAISGTVNRPEIKGYLSAPLIEIPTIKTTIKSAGLHFNRSSISANCPQLQIANSLMGFNAVIDSNFSRGILVQSVDFYSSYLDLDTLGAAMSNLPQSGGADLGIEILGGKGHINRIKTGGLLASNASADFVLKNNVLKMSNVQANAYLGKVAGDISFNLISGKIGLDLQGRGLSAGPAIKGLTGLSDKITGQLDFDSNISMAGATQYQLMKSLKGNTEFIISNGKMGTLGKLEHLLYAQNILSNNFFKTTINVIAKAVSVKDTGVFKYIKGKLTFSNGWANLTYIKTSGPSMSMYITGRVSLLDSSANLVILGRLSDDVVKLLGPIGDFSVSKLLSYIPKVGNITNYLIDQMTTNPAYENTSLIPDLTPKTELPTREFKVMINGGVESQSSVKSFKWLSKPQANQTTTANSSQTLQQMQNSLQNTVQGAAKQVFQQVVPKYTTPTTVPTSGGGYVPPKKIPVPVADFINSLPDLK